jgi:putative redox protein
MGSVKLNFPGGAGHTLAGTVELPEDAPKAYAVFAPCFTCSKDSKAIVRISRELTDSGVAVLRYDVTGIGESEGDFSQTTFATQVDDLIAAVGLVRARHEAPALVLGVSLGGAVALAAAPRLPDIEAVCLLNAPASLDHLRTTLLRLAPDLRHTEAQDVLIVGQRVRVGRGLVEDLRRHSVIESVARYDRHLLVVAATDDEIVPPEHGEQLFEEASQPKSFLAIPGSDHLMLRQPGNANWVGRMVSLWFERVQGL